MEEHVVGEPGEDLLAGEGGEAGPVGFNRGINDEQSEQHSRENSIEPSTERPRRNAGKTPENGP